MKTMNQVMTGSLAPELLHRMVRTGVPPINFIYVHLNRVIKKYDLDMFYIAGPGHGGPAPVGTTYLEGTYSEIYPDISRDEAGLRKLFTQFSFPGGISSHVAPTTPGSIHQGGEPGYSLSHAFEAAFEHGRYIAKHGLDMPEILNWKWGDPK